MLLLPILRLRRRLLHEYRLLMPLSRAEMSQPATSPLLRLHVLLTWHGHKRRLGRWVVEAVATALAVATARYAHYCLLWHLPPGAE